MAVIQLSLHTFLLIEPDTLVAITGITNMVPRLEVKQCNSFEDRAISDFIYECPILKSVAETTRKCTRMVAGAMAAWRHASLNSTFRLAYNFAYSFLFCMIFMITADMSFHFRTATDVPLTHTLIMATLPNPTALLHTSGARFIYKPVFPCSVFQTNVSKPSLQPTKAGVLYLLLSIP